MYALKSSLAQAGAVKKRSFKRDADETICEKIARLNILPNQFYASLAMFSALKRGRTVPPPPPPAPSLLLRRL